MQDVQPVGPARWEDGQVVGAQPVPAALDRDPVRDTCRRDDREDHDEGSEHGEGV